MTNTWKHMSRAIIPEEQSIKKPFFVGLSSLIVAILFLGFAWPSLPPEIPLFYSRPWGEAQLVPSYFIAIPIVLSGIFLIANSAFAQTIDSYPLIRRMIVTGSAVACVLSVITVIRIILLVA